MSYRVTNHARWTCNGCRKKVLGWTDEKPEGWISVNQANGWDIDANQYLHFCSEACIPPEYKRLAG